MKWQWFRARRMGRMTRDLIENGEDKPFYIRSTEGHLGVTYYYLCDQRRTLVNLCLRGNSKQRRQQRRALLRYLNGAKPNVPT